LFFVKTPRNNFSDPKLQTLIKPVGNKVGCFFAGDVKASMKRKGNFQLNTRQAKERELFVKKNLILLALSFTPYQTFMFLEISFKIRNQHKILEKKVDENFIFCQNPRNNFSEPKLQTLIKPVGNIFDRRDPKKPPLN